jgi:hypothetical protein
LTDYPLFPGDNTILLYRRKEISTSDLSHNKLILWQVSHTAHNTAGLISAFAKRSPVPLLGAGNDGFFIIV